MNPDLPEVADHLNGILHFSVILIILSGICHAGSSSHLNDKNYYYNTEKKKYKSREADLNHRPKDISVMLTIYSPPLYQLSYHGMSKIYLHTLLRSY